MLNAKHFWMSKTQYIEFQFVCNERGFYIRKTNFSTYQIQLEIGSDDFRFVKWHATVDINAQTIFWQIRFGTLIKFPRWFRIHRRGVILPSIQTTVLFLRHVRCVLFSKSSFRSKLFLCCNEIVIGLFRNIFLSSLIRLQLNFLEITLKFH